MIDAAVNKLLHTPTSRIKALAADPRGEELVKAVHHLFDLADTVGDADAAQGRASPPKEEDTHAAPTEPETRGQGATPAAGDVAKLASASGRETLGR
jgi:glutamyl-tRNA reductase